MARTQKIKIEEALKNREEYIAQMAQWTDAKLEKHLDLFLQQLEMAYKQNNHDAFLLLLEYEAQVICARMERC